MKMELTPDAKIKQLIDTFNAKDVSTLELPEPSTGSGLSSVSRLTLSPALNMRV